MTEEEIRAAVLEAIRRVAPEADLTKLAPDADIRDALDIDSMDMNRMLLRLHESTGADIQEKDQPRYSTVAGAIRELRARLSSPPVSSQKDTP